MVAVNKPVASGAAAAAASGGGRQTTGCRGDTVGGSRSVRDGCLLALREQRREEEAIVWLAKSRRKERDREGAGENEEGREGRTGNCCR